MMMIISLIPLLLLLLLLSLFVSPIVSQCTSSLTSDSIPSNPGISNTALTSSTNKIIQDKYALGCSEKSSVPTMTTPTQNTSASPSISNWPRDNCPHLSNGLVNFETIFPSVQAESDIIITTGNRLLFRDCSVSKNIIINRITIQSGAELIFNDQDIELHTREILVEQGGALIAGSESCRLFGKINFVFHGSKSSSAIVDASIKHIDGYHHLKEYYSNYHINSASSSNTIHPKLSSAAVALNEYYASNDPLKPITASYRALATAPSKGIVAFGRVEFHGKLYHPTWTRLSRPLPKSADILFLQESVNWEVGQEIVILTSILYDCPANGQYKEFCTPCYFWERNAQWSNCWKNPIKHQNEVRKIIAISMDSNTGEYAIQVNQTFNYAHYAGLEYQTEVVLLTRRITMRGEESNDQFGGHSKIIGQASLGKFSGVQAINMGQLNILGRYPFHFHLMSDKSPSSYIQDCSVTDAQFRCYVIHGTNKTRLSRNTAYNAYGMCYYLEDGVEEDNLLEYNLAAHVHPIKQPAEGGGQSGETFYSAADLIVPVDTSASGFYILNANNRFIGNAASGGWSGFAFPNAYEPIGIYRGTIPDFNSPYNPASRPLQKFFGNTAHSSGFYWMDHGPCVYTGASLKYVNNVLQYISGRNTRDTRTSDGKSDIMRFQSTKVWLCNKGIAHWGNTALIYDSEIHDIRVSAMTFGDSAMHNTIVNAYTPNIATPSNENWYLHRDKMGFQFYDTYVKTILNEVTFRGYKNPSIEYAIRYMDFSDHFIPQGINSVNKLRFENCSDNAILGISNCGYPDCPNEGPKTAHSSRIYSTWDWDGTMARTGQPSIFGSNFDWWNYEASCTKRNDLKVWVCPWRERNSVAFVGPYIKGLYDGCDQTKFPDSSKCNAQAAPYMVGRLQHWGTQTGQKMLELGPWVGAAGPSNTGWYWRPLAVNYSIDGAPSRFSIHDTMQLTRGSFVVIAISFPPTAQFKVYLQSSWWKNNGQPITYAPIAMAASLSVVNTPREDLLPSTQFECDPNQAWYDFCQKTGGVGPAWYFDGQHLYIRVVPLMCYNRNQKDNCGDTAFYTLPVSGSNVRVPKVINGFSYEIEVTSCSGCEVQSTVTLAGQSVTFYKAPDVPPATPFPTDWGNPRTATPLPAAPQKPTCFASNNNNAVTTTTTPPTTTTLPITTTTAAGNSGTTTSTTRISTTTNAAGGNTNGQTTTTVAATSSAGTTTTAAGGTTQTTTTTVAGGSTTIGSTTASGTTNAPASTTPSPSSSTTTAGGIDGDKKTPTPGASGASNKAGSTLSILFGATISAVVTLSIVCFTGHITQF